ncbi:MAG TPA: endo-1,3-alpha-glucanase family glycosylhydrolase [Candidatus Sulfotelmatobacter sp.]|nr:endo-1,3-alpha-glucanase family glycosylhydrolase [Candidatus Sulfotelmatobacter sp.]
MRSMEQEADANTSAAGNGAHVSRVPLRSLLYPGATTKIYVRVMPWFGDGKHIQVGYHSDDSQQIARQVTDMMSRGIDGAVVDWYGPNPGVSSRSTELLLKESEARGFQFAVSIDGGPLKSCLQRGCDVNAQLLSELQYAEKNFENSPSYMRWQGRPVVFFFDADRYSINWQQMRAGLRLSPLFIFRNSGAFENPNGDGAFAWAAPETANANDPEAMQYLERFYTRAQKNPGKFAMGAIYKGFDDSRASWGQGRRIPENCGQTWLDTFAQINRHYSASHQLPALLIVTWNDYEEGTAIEPGVGCAASVRAGVNGPSLFWDFNGNRNTVDRFVIFDSQDRRRLVRLGETGPHENSFDLRGQNLNRGEHWLFVKAQGKAGMLDAISGPVQYGGRRHDSDDDSR